MTGMARRISGSILVNRGGKTGNDKREEHP